MGINFKKFDGKMYTIEYRSTNKALIDKLAKKLRQAGRKVRVVKVVKTEYRAYKR